LILFMAVIRPADAIKAEEMIMAISTEPATLDPHRNLDPKIWMLIRPCYQRLTAFKPGSIEVQPDLAVTWRKSEDNRLYTFVLNQGHTFSDGSPVNAETVRLSFLRALALGVAGSGSFPFLVDVQVLGPYTLRFVLSRPFPAFPAALAAGPASIVSPGPAGHSSTYLDRRTLGSGPYQLSEWVPQNQISFQARPDLPASPKIKRVTVLVEPDSAKRLDLLEKGKVHLALDLAPDQWGSLETIPTLTQASVAGCTWVYLHLNDQRPWLNEVESRRALALALNYDHLVEARPGEKKSRITGLWPHGSDRSRTEADDHGYLRYSPEDAREKFGKIGRPEHDLLLLAPESPGWMPALAGLIRKQLHEVGLAVRLSVQPDSLFRPNLVLGHFDLALDFWRPEIFDPYVYLSRWAYPPAKPGASPSPGSRNSAVEKMLAEAAREKNKIRRRALYARIETALLDDLPFIWLFQTGPRFGLSLSLQGFSPQPPDGSFSWTDLSLAAPTPPDWPTDPFPPLF